MVDTEKLSPVIYRAHPKRKLIALTFDDGPDAVYTPQVLDIFRQYGGKATFFAVGEHIEKYPDLLVETYREGHEVGNHTLWHPDLTQTPLNVIESEIAGAHEMIEAMCGKAPKIFRPPYGLFDDRVRQISDSFGYDFVMWSDGFEMYDWELPGVGQLVSTAREADSGTIILFHDAGGNRDQTMAAVRQIIPAFMDEGYAFVTVSELLSGSASGSLYGAG